EYDEKFHVLQAPTLFFRDVQYFRSVCEDRNVAVAVPFLDIDDFKSFNTAYIEPVVDRNVLPRFMQCLESHVYHHGYAYRQGDDEYLVVVPALPRPLALAFFEELRLTLAGLQYPEVKGRTTVSMGLCVVDPDCHLTDRELLERASVAKKYAKENG